MRYEELFESGKDVSSSDILGLLKACTNQKDLDTGSKIHAYIREHRFLAKNAYISGTLVNMYAKCGALSEAQRAIKELPVRNAVAWNALIAGYVQYGQRTEALKCFDDMLREGRSPTVVTFVCVLKACGSTGSLTKGEEIHFNIVNLGMLDKDVVLGNTLVDMYAKCGAFVKAHQVLEELPIRDVVSWNALIAGYTQKGQGEEAFQCFFDMLYEGHIPTAVTFICILKACGSIGSAAKGKEIHAKIKSLGMLDKDILLANSLVDMYVKCGVLSKAQQVLEDLPVRDVVSWSALIAGYAEEKQGEKALECFDGMLQEGHTPTVVTFVGVLKACGSIEAATKGEEIHDKIVNLGMLDIVLGNTLVDMYVKFGALAKAQRVLEELPVRNVITWSALIAGYTQHGQGEEAMKCFVDMLHEGHTPNVVTFVCVLKACGSIRAAAKGEEIHEKIVSLRMLGKEIMLGNALLDMYVKCGALVKARQVLEELFVRDVVSWSAVIAGYAEHGQGEEALKCFDDMLREGHFPTVVTFVCVLKACRSIGLVAKGEEIHDMIVSSGMLDIVLGNTLVDMYSKCGALTKAQRVLKELPVRNVVTWSALIAGYAQQGQGEEALKCFNDMLHEGFSPNVVTFVCILKACGNIGAVARGKEIHEKIVSLGMLKKDTVLGNALVHMYMKCGAIGKAQQLLQDLPVCDVVSWSAVIAGYAEQGQGEEALKCLNDMLHWGHTPTSVTFISALKACGRIGLAIMGEEIHENIVNLGMLEKDVVLGNSLLDMYVKCGALAKAQRVLEKFSLCTVVSWSALIAGYAQQGWSMEAIDCFERMQLKGVKPNSFTFTSVFNTCSHSGLVDWAKFYFSVMGTKYGIHQNLEHYCCMIDVFGRAGMLNRALSVIAYMPSDKYFPSWFALLGACRKVGEVKIGRLAFEHALDLGENNPAVYVLMADIYTAAGMQKGST